MRQNAPDEQTWVKPSGKMLSMSQIWVKPRSKMLSTIKFEQNQTAMSSRSPIGNVFRWQTAPDDQT